MLKKTIYIIILIIYLISCNFIYKHYTQAPKTEKEKNKIREEIKPTIPKIYSNVTYTPIKDTSIGTLTIDKINLKQKIYNMESKENNIEKNVTILKGSEKPTIDNSIMFIAAHSGTGKKAFFKNLHKLNINDEINLEYEKIIYTYIIKDIWESPKSGNIIVNKENVTQLILTTCSQKSDNMQLIINSVLIKKSN